MNGKRDRTSRIVSLGALVATGLVISERSALAYIDPGTGSIVFQAVIGAALASLVAIKVFWARVKHFVGVTILRRQPKTSAESDEGERR